MDFSDINKIANRKTMTEDFKMLREKISRETENVLKLKVAQDTSYWCLKEKYQQLEANHARLQQNMVEMQTQYETVSALYQDELRRRPETLNKVTATREICNVLVEHIEKLKETLARTKADQEALADAYELASQEVQKIGENFTTTHNRARQEIRALHNQLERSKESEAKALNEAREAKAYGELLKREGIEQTERANVEQAHFHAMLLEASKTVADLHRRIEQYQSEYAKTTEILKASENLQKECAEAQRMAEEERALRQAADTSIVNLEATLNSLKLEHAVLMENSNRKILDMEMLVKSKDSGLVQITSQMETLKIESSEKQAEAQRKLEESALKAQKDLDELRMSHEKKVSELESIIGQKDAELDSIIRQKDTELETIIRQKDTELESIIGQKDAELDSIIRQKDTELESIIRQKDTELESIIGQKDAELDSIIRQKDTELETIIRQKDTELESIIAKKDAELEAQKNAITQLMSDVTNSTHANARLESALKHAHERAQVSAESERSLQMRFEMLQADLQEQIITNTQLTETKHQITAEKERLETKCQGLQNTIENVHKELTDSEHRKEPKHNSRVMKQDGAKSVGQLNCSLFSDTSDDDPMALDRADINRRFEALQRGERITEPLRTRGEMARIRSEMQTKRRRSFFPSRGGLDKKPKRQQTDI